ncbi:CRISPR-associated helicase/endonuclease Cas3 [Enterococcus florum]|uniref:CRISPR-associated helicase/endonuclease Cas3 n=1 Tax=Enterococcus florum TaxID=2480627 RepID=A0A4P5PBG3_9ENTE|nr:CRISPR-associated helicase Cas3' [Enterococcus florum]GCF95497.1 CRISPR-associated helicase/endonuclease Cas3 [Enterococcus florum]
MKKRYLLAKSSTKVIGKVKNSRTLAEHTQDLLNCYDQIMTSAITLPEKEKQMIREGCVWHDLGKINSKFQNKIYQGMMENGELSPAPFLITCSNPEKEEMKHNLLSPAFFYSALQNRTDLSWLEKQVLLKAVMYHHGSFGKYYDVRQTAVEEAIFYDIYQDIISQQENFDFTDIEEVLADELSMSLPKEVSKINFEYYSDFQEPFDLLAQQNQVDLTEAELSSNRKKVNQLYIEVKGFINLLDHLASSQEGQSFNYYFTQQEQAETDQKLLSFIQHRTGNAQAKFNVLQEEIVQFAEQPLVITEAFTSAGKTICSDRLTAPKKLYLVPNRISAMSFYQEAVEKFGQKNVGVLHGTLHLYQTKEDEDAAEISLSANDIELARNFAKPYLLATVDQIAMTLFKYPAYEKVLAVMKEARICVDEIHLLSPRMFLAFILLMDYAMEHLNTKFHLMTATLPASYKKRLAELSNYEGIHQVDTVKRDEKTIQLSMDHEEMEIVAISQQALSKNQQVLIILNDVDSVIRCYKKLKNELPDGTAVQCLHGRFKENDSKRLYGQITQQEGQIWLTTQVVEIALDIDFPVVISDLAPMDSLVQRMGRNNRRGKLADGGLFYLLKPKTYSVYDQILLDETSKLLKKGRKKVKKNEPWLLDMVDRKDLLSDYYQQKKVEQFFESEFAQAEKEIRKIFGLTNRQAIDGEMLILEEEPYQNIADNKNEAAKYFRNSDMRIKIYLEEDISLAEQEGKDLVGEGIAISGRRYYQLLSMNAITEKQYRKVLLKDNYVYDQKFGLDFMTK